MPTGYEGNMAEMLWTPGEAIREGVLTEAAAPRPWTGVVRTMGVASGTDLVPGDGRRKRGEGQYGSTAANLRVSRDSTDGRARLFWKPQKRQMLVVHASHPYTWETEAREL